MNKILVRSNIVFNCDSVLIDGNRIIFKDSGKYLIEYDNDNIDLVFEINDLDVVLYESCFDKQINLNNRYILNGGSLVVNKFYNNNGVNEVIDIDLCKINSKIDYKFSNICKGNESYIININHNNKNTVSNISNKSIGIDNCKLDFIINSRVSKEYDGCILDQNTRIVTMGNCDTKICPNMYIDCDDTIARHGSVVGTFKDEMLFYLMSRGISYEDSVKLLVKGYLFSNIDVDSEMREKVLNVIDEYWR